MLLLLPPPPLSLAVLSAGNNFAGLPLRKKIVDLAKELLAMIATDDYLDLSRTVRISRFPFLLSVFASVFAQDPS